MVAVVLALAIISRAIISMTVMIISMTVMIISMTVMIISMTVMTMLFLKTMNSSYVRGLSVPLLV